MRYDSDIFDEVIQADVDEIAPGMREAIHKSLHAQFEVREVNIRTVLPRRRRVRHGAVERRLPGHDPRGPLQDVPRRHRPRTLARRA